MPFRNTTVALPISHFQWLVQVPNRHMSVFYTFSKTEGPIPSPVIPLSIPTRLVQVNEIDIAVGDADNTVFVGTGIRTNAVDVAIRFRIVVIGHSVDVGAGGATVDLRGDFGERVAGHFL
jgi:hypothetical protein